MTIAKILRPKGRQYGFDLHTHNNSMSSAAQTRDYVAQYLIESASAYRGKKLLSMLFIQSHKVTQLRDQDFTDFTGEVYLHERIEVNK